MVKKIAIISLSRGLLGESFIKHELEIGMKRLKAYGLNVVITQNALKGMDFLEKNPKARAQDLLDAFNDKSIDMILCAIGGDDTYRLLPYLFENNELQNAAANNSKIFLGYSDTTINHFMLYKAGINTFYGQAFLPDICELENEMLPYTKKYFEELLKTGTIKEIRPSDVWYSERKNFDESQIGIKRIRHKNQGFELLQGSPVFSGKILGGCIESIYCIFDNSRHNDTVELCGKYKLFPEIEDWKGKILLLESSEEFTKPELYKKMLIKLKETGIFEVIGGVLVGKPMDEVYYDEYKRLLVEIIGNVNLPIVYNVNIGHAAPKCIIPFGIDSIVDTEKQLIRFK
ncbi:S66 family peptidase [Treponema pedis]|uniref:S66 family peptidase n=1 Tax=Treponema pedis TaxID=409322 RepID=UPI0003F5DFEF|nr:S66 peptidase family protein [Treponema pedis]